MLRRHGRRAFVTVVAAVFGCAGVYLLQSGRAATLATGMDAESGLRAGNAFPDGGDAINIGGFGAIGPVTNITVTNNSTCNAGTILVVQGAGNTVKDNTSC